MKAQFVNLQAAADYMGPGAIEVDLYQSEITDIVRRRGPFGLRIKQVPATGHPSRFFEETAIPSPTAANAFVDPRNIVPTLVTPTRVEHSVPLKCLVSQINYNVFDMEVGAQQSQFAYLQAKDLADSVEGLLRTHDVALWNGTDTSLNNPTTPQYFGVADKSPPAATLPPSPPLPALWTASSASSRRWSPTAASKSGLPPSTPTRCCST